MSTSINHINLCVQSTGSEDDWKNLYEASFPQDERMSVTEVRTLLASGTMLLHKTTDAQGALLCFSLVTILQTQLLLAYIATDQTKRSSGVGSKHMKELIALLKKLHPTYLGLVLEIESTKEKNLPIDEENARKRRLAFYQRLQCKRMLGKEYLLPSYSPSAPARQGELLWYEFSGSLDNDLTLKGIVHEIYTKAYGLPTTDASYVKVISQFNNSTITPPSPVVATAPTPANGTEAAPASAPAPASVSAPASSSPVTTVPAPTAPASPRAVTTVPAPTAPASPRAVTTVPAPTAPASPSPATTVPASSSKVINDSASATPVATSNSSPVTANSGNTPGGGDMKC